MFEANFGSVISDLAPKACFIASMKRCTFSGVARQPVSESFSGSRMLSRPKRIPPLQ
jgi:hypothetical protein